MKIYTKGGDKGYTSLFGGKKISKSDIQIEAYGTVDELNSQLGLLLSYIEEEDLLSFIKPIQSFLFDIGSHLASDGSMPEYLPELQEDRIKALEEKIDAFTETLEPLKSFIMPGGNTRIAQAHVCRTVCRRAERRVIALSSDWTIHPMIIPYLNRLSDFFFVLSRYLAKLDNIDEVRWNPK